MTWIGGQFWGQGKKFRKMVGASYWKKTTTIAKTSLPEGTHKALFGGVQLSLACQEARNEEGMPHLH